MEERISELYARGHDHERIAELVSSPGRILIAYQVKLYLRRAAEAKGMTRAQYEQQLRQC